MGRKLTWVLPACVIYYTSWNVYIIPSARYIPVMPTYVFTEKYPSVGTINHILTGQEFGRKEPIRLSVNGKGI